MDRIDEYLDDLADRDKTEATIATFGTILRHADRELEYGLAEANSDEIRDWINQDNRSRSTRSTYRTAIAGFFGFHCDPMRDDRLDYDPTILVPKVRVPRRPPRPAAEDIVSDILGRARDPFRGWYALAGFGGLRCIEIAALDRGHITEESMELHGKGGKYRSVPVHPLAWQAVKDLPPGPIARDSRGLRATRVGVCRRGNRYLHEALGYPQIGMHMLRHRFATEIYRASDYDLRLTQDLLGHASPATTARYVAVASPARTRAVQRLRSVA